MADGAVLKFIYTSILALINHFLKDWRSFDGWCAAQRINPQKISGRRMINLMIYSIEQTLTEEGRKELRHSLEQPVERQTYKSLKKETGKNKSVPAASVGKWKAPPGWTPPGWDEERSYKSAVSFMGFQANPK